MICLSTIEQARQVLRAISEFDPAAQPGAVAGAAALKALERIAEEGGQPVAFKLGYGAGDGFSIAGSVACCPCTARRGWRSDC